VLKRIAGLLAVLLLVFAGPPPAEPARPGLTPADFVPGEVLVRFRPGKAPSALAQLRPDVLGFEELPALKLHRLRVPPGREREFIEWLRHRPDVEHAQPNYVYRALFTPNDPYFGQQWNLPAIQAPEAWDITQGSAAVRVAVVDTGVDCRHPDLQDQCVDQFNYLTGSRDAGDDNGHGTHVAGIIAARTNNGVGVAGIASGVKLVALKVLDQSGQGDTATVARAIADAAGLYGAKVINLSLGGPRDASGPDPILQEGINEAYRRGAVIVAAAGNCYPSCTAIIDPAALDHVIAVAAVDGSRQRAAFSNYGNYIDIAAPGVNICSTYPGNRYARRSGTSMAAPHVSAVAALVLSVRPRFCPDTIASILFQTADDLGSPGWDQYYGYGLVNAYRAVRAVAPSTGPPPPTLPYRLFLPLVARSAPAC